MACRLASVLFLLSVTDSSGLILRNADSSSVSSSSTMSRRLRNHLYQQMSKAGLVDGNRYVPGSDGTYSQNYQDKWIAAVARHNGWDKPGGFFLDLGAFDGLKCSNSALVEKSFGWNGICVEPRPTDIAFKERNCSLVRRPLSDATGRKVRFYGTPGTQLQHISKQAIDRANDQGEVLETLSMADLVACVNSEATSNNTQGKCKNVPGGIKIPKFINFVSLDVEGQGYNALKTFPFDQVKVGAWVIESEMSGGLDAKEDELLRKNGYIRVPVEHPGVDKYFVQPQFWDPSLAKKAWRIHPPRSEC